MHEVATMDPPEFSEQQIRERIDFLRAKGEASLDRVEKLRAEGTAFDERIGNMERHTGSRTSSPAEDSNMETQWKSGNSTLPESSNRYGATGKISLSPEPSQTARDESKADPFESFELQIDKISKALAQLKEDNIRSKQRYDWLVEENARLISRSSELEAKLRR